jgi:glucokinase
MARHAINEGRGKVISDLVAGDKKKVTAETVYQAALKGDGDASDILERAGRYLGMGIASAINIFAPQMVVIGGGMMSAGDFILRPARDEAMRRALKPFTQGLSIVPAELGGWAGAMGAAFYARQKTGGL